MRIVLFKRIKPTLDKRRDFLHFHLFRLHISHDLYQFMDGIMKHVLFLALFK